MLGRHGVDPHVGPPELVGGVAHERLEARLRHAVRRHERVGERPGDRRQADEGAAAGARHRGRAVLQGEEGALEVDVHHAVPLRHRHGHDRARPCRCRPRPRSAGGRRWSPTRRPPPSATSSSSATSQAIRSNLRAVGRVGLQLGDRGVEPLLAAAGDRHRRAVAQRGGAPRARPMPLPPPVISAAVPASTSSAMSSPSSVVVRAVTLGERGEQRTRWRRRPRPRGGGSTPGPRARTTPAGPPRRG